MRTTSAFGCGWASVIAGNRLELRGLIGQIEEDFVDVAPTPAFGRIIALDDRMAGRVEMARGVAMRRIVATADMTASPANPQMQPTRADFETLLAAMGAGGHLCNGGAMRAGLVHAVVLS